MFFIEKSINLWNTMTEKQRIDDIITGISDAYLEGYIDMTEARRRVKLLVSFLSGMITFWSLSNQFMIGE